MKGYTVSNEAIEYLRGLYKSEYGANLTFEEAKEAARRLVAIYCQPLDEIHPLRSQK